MPEILEKTFVKARRASAVGAVCMYAIAILSAFNFITFLYTITSTSVLSQLTEANQLIMLLTTLLTSISILLLGEFLRHFGFDSSPFGKRQSIRLLSSGVLFSIRMILESLFPEPQYFSPVSENSWNVIVTSQPGPDLKVIVMIVFLICLAMVVRYGDALKEDSDSIA